METLTQELFPERDWTGRKNAALQGVAPSNQTKNARVERDFYATEPRAVELLCEIETFQHDIWEPACGMGHISNVLKAHGYNVRESDIVDRIGNEVYDFLTPPLFGEVPRWHGDIITNPPYVKCMEFVERALEVVDDGAKVAMFLKLEFLTSKKRRALFERSPFKTMWVSSATLQCLPNGEPCTGQLMTYAWFVWEKGYKGDPVIKWFN